MLIGGGLQGLVCVWLACGLFYRAAKADYSVDPLTLSMPFTFVVADLSMASTTFLLPIESLENPLPWSVLAAGLSSGRCIAEIPVVDYNFSPLFSNQIHRPFGNSEPVRSLGRSILHQSALANHSSIRLRAFQHSVAFNIDWPNCSSDLQSFNNELLPSSTPREAFGCPNSPALAFVGNLVRLLAYLCTVLYTLTTVIFTQL